MNDIPKYNPRYFAPKPEIDLQPCPWCHERPIFVIDKADDGKPQHEIWCINKTCRANPRVSREKGYNEDQVTRVWNSWKTIKREAMDIRNFRKFYSKKELNKILFDVIPPPEIWEKYIPDIPYMTIEEEQTEHDRIEST